MIFKIRECFLPEAFETIQEESHPKALPVAVGLLFKAVRLNLRGRAGPTPTPMRLTTKPYIVLR
jgi:hypothetical protein